MRFTTVDFNSVQRAIDTESRADFNSYFHSAASAQGQTEPSEAPYAFSRWLPLILRSRGLPDEAVQVASLARAQVRVLVGAAAASVHTRVLNRALAEDLRDGVAGALSAALAFPPEGLFLRLDHCSPKDGAHGKLALHSVDDVLLRLTTSVRAWRALGRTLGDDDGDGGGGGDGTAGSMDGARREAPVERLYFLPFDSRMDPAHEYRVFCAPGSLRIAAVSQYRWHEPWALAAAEGKGGREEMAARARGILDWIAAVHGQILACLGEPGESEMDDLLRTQGLSFDVLHRQESGDCALVELNPFGARSGCGSALFHWLKDRELLYGERLDEGVEFRVAV